MMFDYNKFGGSRSHDAFKMWHKSLLNNFYASDVDLVLISKNPPGVIAVIDYKQRGTKVTFAEVVLYNAFVLAEIPVFIVYADWNSNGNGLGQFGPLDVYQYLYGDWKPDDTPYELLEIATGLDRQGFMEWEYRLRIQYESVASDWNSEIENCVSLRWVYTEPRPSGGIGAYITGRPYKQPIMHMDNKAALDRIRSWKEFYSTNPHMRIFRPGIDELPMKAIAGEEIVKLVCPIHHASMDRHEKDGEVWYSHPYPRNGRVGWCRGKE
jgi:hypothetical protein